MSYAGYDIIGDAQHGISDYFINMKDAETPLKQVGRAMENLEYFKL